MICSLTCTCLDVGSVKPNTEAVPARVAHTAVIQSCASSPPIGHASHNTCTAPVLHCVCYAANKQSYWTLFVKRGACLLLFRGPPADATVTFLTSVPLPGGHASTRQLMYMPDPASSQCMLVGWLPSATQQDESHPQQQYDYPDTQQIPFQLPTKPQPRAYARTDSIAVWRVSYQTEQPGQGTAVASVTGAGVQQPAASLELLSLQQPADSHRRVCCIASAGPSQFCDVIVGYDDGSLELRSLQDDGAAVVALAPTSEGVSSVLGESS